MVAVYLPVMLILAVALLIAVGMFIATTAIGPKNMTPEKAIPYESGSETEGARHIKLSVKFYLTAILFVVFDIEAVFLLPWAVYFKQLQLAGLLTMGLFIGILMVGFAYAWKRGALEWV